MIYGIGMDSVQIERMEKLLCKEHFMQRVFTQQERAFFLQKEAKAAQSAAACFAAKEALLKACGKGLWGFAFSEIQVLHKASGAPFFSLCGKAQAFCEEHALTAHLSLSHESGLAFAFVVLDRHDEHPIAAR